MCRFKFCECCKSQKIRVDDAMFSDDTCYHLNVYVNHHKTVSRVQHNPYVAVDARGQTTVRCATHGNTLLGPDLGRRMESRKISPVAECVRNVSGWIVTHNRYRFYFQQDGEPPHSAGEVQKLLDGRGARDQLESHQDFKPLHVFLWGRLKSLVLYAAYVSLMITKLATLDIITQTSQPVWYSVQHHIHLCEQPERLKLLRTFPSLLLWLYEAGLMTYRYFCVFYLYKNKIIQFTYIRVICNFL
jgi:hypothetical protein